MDADLLARWMSEVQHGSLDDLSTRIRWLAATGQHGHRDTRGFSAGRWLRDAETMCLARVDWTAGSWRAAPTVITRLPQSDGTALLAGARPASVLDRLASEDLAVTFASPPRRSPALPPPSAVLISYDSPAQLPELARRLGARYVPCSALQLGSSIAVIRPGDAAAPPASGNATVECYAPLRRAWEPVSPRAAGAGEGLYRLRRDGRMAYLLQRAGAWHRTTYAEGIHFVLAACGAQPLRWRAEPGRQQAGTFFVDYGAPLPPLQAAAAALCTGLPPRLTDRAETVAFDNVPLSLARQLAGSLGHRLEEQ
ncbi:hypothetical protein GA0070620_3841 [Micromonospora krabiensis]|uniref:Uncharacterized protein n=1 Tax=Micromonospora krabiensis TaxID=307121 RepID=A0A1C3N6V0_9ACTN|nr:hypothetical protein GA0070620_3841 [Micromonospora krabiensis]